MRISNWFIAGMLLGITATIAFGFATVNKKLDMLVQAAMHQLASPSTERSE